MVKAQVLVDVRRGRFAGSDGPDNRGRAGDTVSAGEHTFHIRNLCAGIGGQGPASLDADTRLFKAMAFNALSNGHDDGIRRDAARLHVCGFRARPAPLIHLADDLRLCPQCGDTALFIGLDPHRRLKCQQFRALRGGPLHFFPLGRHILQSAAIDAGDLIRSQTDGTAGHIHGHISAADDNHALPGKIRQLVIADAAQQFHSRDHALAVLALDAGFLVRVGPNGDVQAVMLFAQLIKCDILSHLHAGMDFDAKGQD